jgi:branched-chain amino acid transport system substrate-binding protein
MKSKGERVSRVTLRRMTVTLVAATSVVLAACGNDDSASNQPAATTTTSISSGGGAATTTAAPSPEDETIEEVGLGKSFKVGAILPLTGPAGAIGQDFEAALRVFERIDPTAAKINIEFVVCDDGTTPDGASACALRLIQQDRVDMIYGPVISGLHAAATPVLAGGPPSMSPSPYISVEQGDPIFSAAGRATDLDRSVLQFAADRGYSRVAVLATTDTTGETAVKNLQAANASIGLSVAIERMGPGDVDVSAQANRLLETDPEMVYIASSGAATGVALQAFAQLEADLPTALIWSNTSPAFLRAAGPVMPSETLYALAPSWLADNVADADRARLITAFKDSFEQESGAKPSFLVQGGYDAFQLIASALLTVGNDKAAIVNYLENLTDFQGLNWQLSYSATNHLGKDTGNYQMFRYDPASGNWSLAR